MTNLNNTLHYYLKNIPNDKLLAPIVYNEGTHGWENIKHCDYILSSLPNNNMVKVYLIRELKNIIIKKGKVGKKYKDILNNISMDLDSLKIDKNERNKNFYNSSFVFNFKNVLLNSKLNKSQQYKLNKLNQIYTEKVTNFNVGENGLLNKITEDTLIGKCGRSWKSITTYYNVNKGRGSYSKSFDILSCCYAIIFKNNLYYYIGSTANITDRVRDHHLKIQRIIGEVVRDGFYYNRDVKTYYNSNMLQYYIASEILNEKRNIEYTILPVYFCTNYLKKFELLNPDYRLSKGEKTLLLSITELIIRILEQSLIIKFKPKLNIHNNVAIRQIKWDDSYLVEWDKPFTTHIKQSKELIVSKINKNKSKVINSNPKELLSKGKYLILIPHLKKKLHPNNISVMTNRLKDLDLIHLGDNGNTIYSTIGPYTLYQTCIRFSLNIYEVLDNINKLHNYKGCTLLPQPMFIIAT